MKRKNQLGPSARAGVFVWRLKEKAEKTVRRSQSRLSGQVSSLSSV